MYARTFSKMGKIKRLKREGRVRVAPCDAGGKPKGEWTDAKARIIAPDAEEARRANELLNGKYGLTKRLMEPFFGLRYGEVVTVAIQI